MFGSANANSAPTFGGFGSNSNSGAASNTGGLFGNTNKPAASGIGFGGTNNTNQSGGGLFGGNSNTGVGGNTQGSGGFGFNQPATNLSVANNNQSQSGGLFGSKPTTTGFGNIGGANGSTQPNTGGLFGAAKPAGGNLFGSTTQNDQSGQTGKNSFGFGSTANNSTQQTQSGGLFGANSKPAQSSTGGLFGSSSNSSLNPTNSMFGSSNKPTQPSTGLFGSNNTNQNSSGGLFGSSNSTGLLGSNLKPPQQSSLFGGGQGTTINNNSQNLSTQELSAMTRVGDLNGPMKAELEAFDKYINTQHLIAQTLQEDLNKHDQLIQSIPRDINYVNTKLTSTRQALKFDNLHLLRLREVNNEISEDINKMMQLIVQLSTPGTNLSSSIQLNEYFVRKIKRYYELLHIYESTVKEAQEVISGLEKSCTEKFVGLYSIIEVLKAQFKLFMELCESMASIHNDINRLIK